MTAGAVIGCGTISVVHLGAIAGLDGVDLVGVCDTDADRAAEVGEKYGVPWFTDHRELLATVRPQVVHVCTPHNEHVPVAIDSLDAGVAVLVEKPVGPHRRRGRTAHRRDTGHTPTSRSGCASRIATTRACRRPGRCSARASWGRVIGGSATLLWHRDPAYYEARPWRGRQRDSGGGVLINQAIHTLDLLQWLLGDVARVRGNTGRYALDGIVDVEDTASVVLDHAGGARSVVFATLTNVTDAPVTLEIVTERAVLLIRGDLTVTYLDDGRTETVAERRVAHRRQGVLGSVARPAHRRLLSHSRPAAAVLDRPGRGDPIAAPGRPDLPIEQLTQKP